MLFTSSSIVILPVLWHVVIGGISGRHGSPHITSNRFRSWSCSRLWSRDGLHSRHISQTRYSGNGCSRLGSNDRGPSTRSSGIVPTSRSWSCVCRGSRSWRGCWHRSPRRTTRRCTRSRNGELRTRRVWRSRSRCGFEIPQITQFAQIGSVRWQRLDDTRKEWCWNTCVETAEELDASVWFLVDKLCINTIISGKL